MLESGCWMLNIAGFVKSRNFDYCSVGKQGFYVQVDQADSNAMDFAKHTMTMTLGAEDTQNGIKAFLNKETPVWKNR